MGAFFKTSSLTSFQSFYEICLAILYMKGNLSTSCLGQSFKLTHQICSQMAVELLTEEKDKGKWLTGWKQMQHTHTKKCRKQRQEEEIDEVCETE